MKVTREKRQSIMIKQNLLGYSNDDFDHILT